MYVESTIKEKVYFSVVIPLYNRERLIKRTIESVLKQNTKVSFEIIIIDDGSTDGSAKKIEEFDNPKIQYVYQKNQGATMARNRGIDLASGAYIAFLDSDDVYLENHLEKAREILDTHSNTVVYSQIIVDRGNNNSFIKPPRALKDGEHMAEYLLCDRGFLQTSTLVVPASVAKTVRFTNGLPFGQDTDFAIRLYNKGLKFFMIDRPTVIWTDVKDPNRVSSRYLPEDRINWLMSVKEIIPERAFKADMGWFVAKALSRKKAKPKALRLYINAVLNRCYKPSLACVIFMQVFFDDSFFRYSADIYVKIKKRILKGI